MEQKSLLQQANDAFRCKEYEVAITLYAELINSNSQVSFWVIKNIDILMSKVKEERLINKCKKILSIYFKQLSYATTPPLDGTCNFRVDSVLLNNSQGWAINKDSPSEPVYLQMKLGNRDIQITHT